MKWTTAALVATLQIFLHPFALDAQESASDKTAVTKPEIQMDTAAAEESDGTVETGGTTRQNSTNTLRLAEGAEPPAATISDLAWLTGYWKGKGLGGDCEEMWGHSLDGRMFGTFVYSKDGKVVFSEAMVLAEEKGSLVLKVKHFDPEFKGWEEKDGYIRFPLVHLEENTAYFSGLTMKREDDSLNMHLVLSQKGKKGEVDLQFKRVEF